MITLEQIRRLQDKVEAAVLQITELRSENYTLKSELDRHLNRIKELEDLINEFKDAQKEIESGILSALDQLDRIENETVGRGSSEAAEGITEEDPPTVEPSDEEFSPDHAPTESSSSGSDLEPDDETFDDETESGELDIF